MTTIYADNAATTKLSKTALDAMMPYLTEQYGNPSSLHTVGQLAAEGLFAARKTMAECLGCDPKEIIFTGGGSEADNQALLTGAEIGARKGKKHIISDTIEHHAVLHSLKHLEKLGFEVTLLPVDGDGRVDPEAVRKAIRPDTALVTVMMANNEIGTLEPVREIASICHENGVLFHTDAVQAVGHIPVNVKEIGCDMLSLAGHKFHGPKGVGALYARKGLLVSTLIEGGAQERGKRAGTENIAGIVGMAAALREAVDNLETNVAKITRLRDRLIEGLAPISHSILNGSREHRLPGNVNMCFEGIEGESLLLLLDQKGICASSGSACTSGSLDPSHVLLAIGRIHDVAHGSLRLSLSEYNTEEEIDTIIKAVPEVVDYLRRISPVWQDLQEGKRNYVIQ
ncbi:MAG: cysteine desulfurase NifS [Oscillospiraceae bacterium]|nr:cysteine desulfurase NifS [Oscillospiraceae bacterium]